MATRKKTASDAAPDVAPESALETASTSKSASASVSLAVSETASALLVRDSNPDAAIKRSSLELRVLPSFDPRVKLLVKMMSRIESAAVEDQGVGSYDANEVIKRVEGLLKEEQDKIKEAGLEVKILNKGVATRQKTPEDRVADFLPVAAKIMKGKHPDFIGWLRLDKDVLLKNMVQYINFFYGAGDNKPDADLEKKIKDLLDKADAYFDDLINAQDMGGGSGLDQKFGMKNIEEFLEEAVGSYASSSTDSQ